MKRRVAREIALQVLYQMEMNQVSAAEAIRIAIEEAENDNEANLDVGDDKISPQYIKELVDGTQKHLPTIDELLLEYLKGWQMDRLSRVDRQVLRLAVYEMIYREDVPPKVVVNEAIELAKHFGTEESGKFVNGVLGRMIKELEAIKSKALQKHEQ
ncbi:transcription antitermination factor NusB [Paenibacillus hamazuiensis]|uniref:transcription antitermination factor NusB n=1 Tax=Paenibacillus hamazuiensis TaxID=2936508 RepID=UPI00200C22A7|nr:transcription antitermination factor NusB [Paenibacillus hamazuiensis]